MDTRIMVAVLAVALGAGCTTEDRDVATTPEPRADDEMITAEQAGEADIDEDRVAWRATADPVGGVGPNAEAMIRVGDEAMTIHVDLDGGEPAAVYPWHIHQGNCGDPSPPIVGSADAYPPITVGSGGEGDAEATVSARIMEDGDYILNVHASPARLDSIIACGDVVASSSPEY